MAFDDFFNDKAMLRLHVDWNEHAYVEAVKLKNYGDVYTEEDDDEW